MSRGRLFAVAGLASVVVLGLLASAAQARIYWTNCARGSIGVANNDGTNTNPVFIVGGGCPVNVALDSAHVYWANSTTGTVGRANLNGTGVNQSFINTSIANQEGPLGVLATSSHVYWSTSSVDYNLISDADLNGTNPVFEIAEAAASQLAVHGGWVYFATTADTIGRVRPDGSQLNAFFINLPVGTFTQGIAVNDQYIYWSDSLDGIGRDTIDGNPANINLSFIPMPSSNEPGGIAIDKHYIYWANFGANTIGRDTIDGNPANVNENFITAASQPLGVAVNP